MTPAVRRLAAFALLALIAALVFWGWTTESATPLVELARQQARAAGHQPAELFGFAVALPRFGMHAAVNVYFEPPAAAKSRGGKTRGAIASFSRPSALRLWTPGSYSEGVFTSDAAGVERFAPQR